MIFNQKKPLIGKVKGTTFSIEGDTKGSGWKPKVISISKYAITQSSPDLIGFSVEFGIKLVPVEKNKKKNKPKRRSK